VANKPPALTIQPPAPVRLPATAPLTVVIQDDGLPKPKPRAKPAVGQETPPTLQGGTSAPVNVPQAALRLPPAGGATGGASDRPLGMVVTWIVWRGPASVVFDPRYAQPKDGTAVTGATFSVPGEYTLRATADDGAAATHAQLTVKVAANTSTPGPR
jgi:hypothetical protein